MDIQQFGIVLLQTILIYMVAGLVFPDLSGEETVDLKGNFYAHRRWFFSLAFAMIIASVLKDRGDRKLSACNLSDIRRTSDSTIT